MEFESDLANGRAASLPALKGTNTVNPDTKGKNVEEPDTCRICRGEGSDDEQLFYPCKCSGSIKFVHQACLMEWLSHSQKKYCELCKTPFRFTKLYDPEMPELLPIPVFIKELILHGVRTLIVWLRFILVAFVWLGWLPWSMRAVWRALFWLADGRWPTRDSSQRQMAQAADSQLSHFAGNGSTMANTTSIFNSTATVTPVSAPVLSMLNLSTYEPMVLSLAKQAFSNLFVPASPSPAGNMSQVNMTVSSYRQRHPSWLSDVTFLKSLTSSPTFNNIVIDTLEGQLITLLVVVSFILVFLIREWVVQQQPAVNLDDGEGDAVVRLIAEEDQPNQEAAPHVQEPEHPPRPPNDQFDESSLEHGNEASNSNSQYIEPSTELIMSSSLHTPENHSTNGLNTDTIQSSHMGSQQFISRPTLHSNDLDVASNIHRTIEETAGSQGNQDWPGLETFKDLWTRGEGNPELILRIIHEEGRQEELGWVVSAMSRQKAQAENIRPADRRALKVQPENLFHGGSSSETAKGSFILGAADEDASLHRHPSQIHQNRFDRDNSVKSGTPMTDETTAETSYIPTLKFSGPLFDVSDNEGLLRQQDASIPGALESTDEREAREPSSSAWPRGFDVGHFTPDSDIRSNSSQAQNSTPSADDTLIIAGQSPAEGPRLLPAEPDTAVPQSMIDKILNWLYGDVLPHQSQEDIDQGGEHAGDQGLEPLLVPAEIPDGGMAFDEPIANAGVDANDAEAVEEGDDLEGIMELIGMQGPIFGLLQNCVFSALLISFTVAVGIWLPYLWGKIALVFLTNPVQLFVGVPLALISIVADVAVDSLIGSVGYIMYWISSSLRFLLQPAKSFLPLTHWIPDNASLTNTSLSLIGGSSQRLKRILDSFFNFHESDLPVFSVLSHHALRIHKARVASLLYMMINFGKLVLHDLPLRILSQDFQPGLLFEISMVDVNTSLKKLWQSIEVLDMPAFSSFLGFDWVDSKFTGNIPLQFSLDQDLAWWDTHDRIIAIIVGYAFASILGLLYLRITGFLAGVNRGQRIEGFVAEILHQAGGVMKVILIIGIEMIVFPLYCGLLLDIALMPLFENATLTSRIDFTITSPLTSLFVHWFVGTCYMFHFALFVSMCRKIMRSGVLYFIRDPDDPTFHPVRDVLERNIMTQLRKIAFSALVYGSLIAICLGGVVWGLALAFDGVFPIHWSSDVPVLEFPVDLLFYNFVMPFAIRSIKPSEDLHGIYNWWFRKCARILRLTEFLFGERHRDEEGHHMRRSWQSLFLGEKGDTENPIVGENQRAIVEEQGLRVYFLRDGKFVRTPASDQVRIPRGGQVFLEVTESNERVDGAPDTGDGLHSKDSDMFTMVYTPPLFRIRIALFIFMIWVFAAVTGVGVTVVPLVIGRRMISSFFPNPIHANDIYAFSAGLYTVGCLIYALFYLRTGLSILRKCMQPYINSPRRAVAAAGSVVLGAIRLTYISVAFVIFLPSLFALLTELYVLVPLHTYLESQQAHVIHFIQDWTLGVLYVQMAVKLILWRSASRPALALKAIVRDGWLRPNVGLATRAILLPVFVLALIAVVAPLCLGWILNTTIFHPATTVTRSVVYRYSYPATFMVGLFLWIGYLLSRQIHIWRVNIRDEVYLVGERLHNFGEKRARDVGVPRHMITR